MPTHAGPAAGLIDWGYAVKRPLCEEVDRAWGLDSSGPYSLTGFLQLCYVVRRPGFVMIDLAWPK